LKRTSSIRMLHLQMQEHFCQVSVVFGFLANSPMSALQHLKLSFERLTSTSTTNERWNTHALSRVVCQNLCTCNYAQSNFRSPPGGKNMIELRLPNHFDPPQRECRHQRGFLMRRMDNDSLRLACWTLCVVIYAWYLRTYQSCEVFDVGSGYQ
jgi:hypothetical protein